MNNHGVVLIKNIFPEVPDWNKFINLMDFLSSDDYSPTGIRNESIGLNRTMYTRLSDAVDLQTQSSNNGCIPELDKVVSYLNDKFNKECMFSECYINFTKHAEFKTPHNDQWTAVAWGCIGSMEWRIYDRFDSVEYDSYIVDPGDLIIVPEGVVHSVIPLSTRASITFAYKEID